MNNIQNILKKISKFEEKLNIFFNPVEPEAINLAEERIGYKLPKDYISFLRYSNGAYILQELIYGLHTEDRALDGLISYNFEKDRANYRIPDYIFPISPDGRGNHYCLDLCTLDENLETCNVVFWQYDYDYNDIDIPEIDANSFSDFLNKIIDEYLEDYTISGTEK